MHVGIFGSTECGKSTLARFLIRQFSAQGRPCLVWDPLGDPAYQKTGAKLVTEDIDEMFSAMRRNPSSSCFFDEAGDEKGNSALDHAARKFRHGGFNLHFMSQRYKDLSPAVRNCLGGVFVFALAEIDAADVSRDFRAKEISQESGRLGKGDYLYKTRFGDLKRGTVRPIFGKV